MREAVSKIIGNCLDTAEFWTAARIRKLQDIATSTDLERGIGDIVDMAMPSLSLRKTSARKYLESFLRREASPIRLHPELLCCLLERCDRLVDRSTQTGASDKIQTLSTELKGFLPLASPRRRAMAAAPDAIGRATPAPNAGRSSADIMQFMTALLAVCRPNIEETADWLFRGRPRQGGDQKLSFDTMRYAKNPGFVARSITTIRPPSKNDLGMYMPFPYFSNFYESKPLGVRRIVHGIAIKLGSHLYLLGGMHQPNGGKIEPLLGLKLMALQITNPRQKNFFGLVLSLTPENDLVAGRIALMSMTTDERTQFQGGRFREEDLLKSASAGTSTRHASASATFKRVRKHIKNHIDFKLIGQLLYNGRPRNQDAIRDLVDQLCRTEEGAARFLLRPVVGDAHEFNPASHEDYPFNQALLAPEI